jgi:hypothetical protein
MPTLRKPRRVGQPWLGTWSGKGGPSRRFYDFNVWSERKQVEKLRYMHRNPVKRGLVAGPDQWAWSSFRAYAYGEKGRVRVNFEEWELKIKPRRRERFGESPAAS